MKANRQHAILGLAMFVVLVTLGSSALAASIPPGVDFYRVVNGTDSYIDFSSSPLAAGSLGAGSGALTGLMPIRSWGPDVAIRRLQTANFVNTTNGTCTVASELAFLNFRLASPMMLNVNGVQQSYDVSCCIRPSPLYKGQMTLQQNALQSGGTILPGSGPQGTYFDVQYSFLPVVPVGANASSIVSPLPPVYLDRISLTESVDWSSTPPKTGYMPTFLKNFYPGVDPKTGALETLHLNGKYLHLDLQLMTTLPYMLPGDSNGDGKVDDGDYTTWADNFGNKYASPGTGDTNWDCQVDDADYTSWADNYGRAAGTAPEPASLALLGMGMAAILRRRIN